MGCGAPLLGRAGGGSDGHVLGALTGLPGKSGWASLKVGQIEEVLLAKWLICCFIYFNNNACLCGVLYSQASEVGGEGAVTPILQRRTLTLGKARPLTSVPRGSRQKSHQGMSRVFCLQILPEPLNNKGSCWLLGPG